MKVTSDTNLLVRIVVGDDPRQTQAALRVLEEADLVAVPLSCLCELVWVLRRVYRLPPERVAEAVRAIGERANVVIDQAAVHAGLAALGGGGDFADGAIAASGAAMGGETFVSFDQKAVALLKAVGMPAQIAGSVA